ncbi:hypothetical protein [Brachybacterium hainanense]|uniref:DUF222 domain-containing protein n=1 Tax=Brachybacterium hainanense TaxID=1541174 RepID=A0ABV6R903_9MICO
MREKDVLRAWILEEHRLLELTPRFRGEVTRIQAQTREELAQAQSTGDGEMKALASEIAFHDARRRIRRARRTHSAEIAELDLTRWRELAETCARGPLPLESARAAARRAVSFWMPTGLGAASVASLSTHSTFVQARASVLAAERDGARGRHRPHGS